jgi:hypothetical protein
MAGHADDEDLCGNCVWGGGGVALGVALEFRVQGRGREVLPRYT